MCFEVLDVIQYNIIIIHNGHCYLPEPPPCVSRVTQVPSLIADVEYTIYGPCTPYTNFPHPLPLQVTYYQSC